MTGAIRVVDPLWIPLSDGTRLCARMWLPEDAEHAPVPAILEYLPYRKDDVTAADDALYHPYFAARGYAAIRVDVRGSGDSDGLLTDEYTPQEQEDALELLAWIAQQPWCTGAIGMMGISWSGFNSLQVAARRPSQLRAIITACSSDDRYDNDVHYYGGLPLGYYLMPWSSVLLAFNARPPDPAIVGERWRELWRQRLDANPHLIETWLAHQHRDDYWRQGSISEDYDAIECAVLAVGGWADAYVDAILRMLEHLRCPRRAIIGPWGHQWPQFGVPGPAIGFLQEAMRWWDHWLKGEDNGVMEEPRLCAWMQEPARAGDDDLERPGRWVAEADWPAARDGQERGFDLDAAPALVDRAEGSADHISHCSPQTVGVDAGAWCAYGNPGDLPGDQRSDDARSLSFDSAPLSDRIEVLGRPLVELAVASDRPQGFVMARLCDVAPDGLSTIVTRGAVNLCHPEGRAAPRELVPGEIVEVTFPLKAVGYALAPGHQLRLALSTSYWPWLWPSRESVTITLETGGRSRLRLPIRAPCPGPDGRIEFGPPEMAPPLAVEVLQPRRPRLEIARDVVSGHTALVMARAFSGGKRFPSGLEYHDKDPVTFSLVEGDPLSARVECRRHIVSRRGSWETSLDVTAVMTADAEFFHVSSTLDAFEGDTRIHTAAHSAAIPRDHV